MSTNYPTKNGVDQAEALEFNEKKITLSSTVTYRGRQITVTVEGYSLDAFADLLDRRCGGTPAAQPEPQPLSTPPSCPVHRKAMKPMKFVGKSGEQWMCTAKVGDDWCMERS